MPGKRMVVRKGERSEMFDFDELEIAELEGIMSNEEFMPEEEDDDGMEGEGEWVRVKRGVTLDSGSSVTIMPKSYLPQFKKMQSPGSMRRQKWVAANNGIIHNEGQKDVDFKTRVGHRKKMRFQVAKVNNILASVGEICDQDNVVKFKKKGGTIKNGTTGEVIHFRRKGNVYVLDIWVRNPKFKPESSGFRGQVRK